ncbi:MAG: hypothetical protein VKL59_25865 [Nostocaceae cyanobacterium]|nr:hypothetical protein [Nostocaceae cyanobacterium]
MDSRNSPGKFGSPVCLDRGGKTTQAVEAAVKKMRLDAATRELKEVGVLLYCTFNGTITVSNPSFALYASPTTPIAGVMCSLPMF